MKALAINKFCPRSGKPINADSLAAYKGWVVGFCNPGCRDDFAENIQQRPDDTDYFEVLIKAHELQRP